MMIIMIRIIVTITIKFIMNTRHHIPEESDLNRGLNVVKTTQKDVASITEIQSTGEGSMLCRINEDASRDT
jgi:hypothetical protein